MVVTGAQIVVHLLEKLGVSTVAGIPGGPILPLYDALAESSIRHVLARHEQGAGFIAQGMARGDWPRWGLSGDQRSRGHQSGDGPRRRQGRLHPPGGAHGQRAPSPDGNRRLPGGRFLFSHHSRHQAQFSGRGGLRPVPGGSRGLPAGGKSPPGPVSVDIPKDVLTDTVEFEAWPEMLTLPLDGVLDAEPDEAWIQAVASAIASARRPVIYAGGGAAGSWETLRTFARAEKIPVATTLMGLGLMDPDDPLWLG